MNNKRIPFYIGGILLLLIIWMVVAYNSLVNKQEKVSLTWSEIQNTYQRRLDLIPNLVSVVKGSSEFEKETLRRIAEARANAQRNLGGTDPNAGDYKKQQESQDSLAANVNRLIILIEKYPELKTTTAYAGLQTQLEGTERRIRVARNDFNAAVAVYNNKLRSFPTSLVGGILGFKIRSGFAADAGAEKTVEIKF